MSAIETNTCSNVLGKSPMNLSLLNDHVVLQIFRHCSLQQQFWLELVCKRWAILINEVWKSVRQIFWQIPLMQDEHGEPEAAILSLGGRVDLYADHKRVLNLIQRCGDVSPLRLVIYSRISSRNQPPPFSMQVLSVLRECRDQLVSLYLVDLQLPSHLHLDCIGAQLQEFGVKAYANDSAFHFTECLPVLFPNLASLNFHVDALSVPHDRDIQPGFAAQQLQNLAAFAAQNIPVLGPPAIEFIPANADLQVLAANQIPDPQLENPDLALLDANEIPDPEMEIPDEEDEGDLDLDDDEVPDGRIGNISILPMSTKLQVKFLIKFFANHPNLEELHLTTALFLNVETYCDPDLCDKFVEVFPSHLRRLSFRYDRSNGVFQELASMGKFRKLKRIALQYTRGLEKLGNIFAACPNLTTLDLSNCIIHEKGFMAIGQLRSLLSLDLSGCSVVDSELDSATASLQNLLALNLNDALISDFGLFQLAQNWPKLQWLALVCRSVKAKGLTEFLAEFKRGPDFQPFRAFHVCHPASRELDLDPFGLWPGLKLYSEFCCPQNPAGGRYQTKYNFPFGLHSPKSFESAYFGIKGLI